MPSLVIGSVPAITPGLDFGEPHAQEPARFSVAIGLPPWAGLGDRIFGTGGADGRTPTQGGVVGHTTQGCPTSTSARRRVDPPTGGFSPCLLSPIGYRPGRARRAGEGYFLLVDTAPWTPFFCL